MKTKIIALILIIASLFIFTGCSDSTVTSDIPLLNDRIEWIYTDAGWNNGVGGVAYYRDVVTDVVYVRISTDLTPLLHADGTPILWSEIEKGVGKR